MSGKLDLLVFHAIRSLLLIRLFAGSKITVSIANSMVRTGVAASMLETLLKKTVTSHEIITSTRIGNVELIKFLLIIASGAEVDPC